MVGGNNNSRQHNDTTSTKIFVGGLAWETQRDTMTRYFEQFGEILEAVIIIDKNTGKSKGYGFVSTFSIFIDSYASYIGNLAYLLVHFIWHVVLKHESLVLLLSKVTFTDPEAAKKACQNPYPIIDGRRTNCNIASIGANKNRTRDPQHGLNPFIFLYLITISSNQFNCYGAFGGQQFSTCYPSNGASGPVGIVHNIYPFSAQYAYNSQAQGFGIQYPQMMQFPIFPRHYGSAGILTFPSSMAMPPTSAVTTTVTTTTTEGIGTSADASQTTRTTSEQNSSAESPQR
ncbi:hypothetical protein Fmac_010715 [Flemingia macrophylla]|uniref:RRM domain-containing protein n=1 Tax=Flemingia macrophylla TaxID=520843 RepID=A0ABD1MKE7_9FABA